MRDGHSPPTYTGWRAAVLSTGTLTILLGIVSIRLHLADAHPTRMKAALLAGAVLVAAASLLPEALADRLLAPLRSVVRLTRWPAAVRRIAGLLLLNLPVVALFGATWIHEQAVHDRAEAKAARPDRSTKRSRPEDYQAIVERARFNASFLPRLQYSMDDEEGSRGRTSAAEENAGSRPAVDLAALRARWPACLQQTYQAGRRAAFHVDDFDMHAPFDAVVHRTLEMTFENAGYQIETLTWQAAPGIDMPAVVYRPRGLTGRLPVVLTPPACHEDVASHRPNASVQRRMANFALAGMLAFSTEGFCANGIIKDVPGNQRRFDSYTVASGSGINNKTLELVVWLRALDYLATRADADMSRVAVTGFSNGAGISKALLDVSSRITAAAIVSSGLPETDSPELYSDVRDNNNVFDKADTFYNTPSLGPALGKSEVTAGSGLDPIVRAAWSSRQLQLALTFGAPRPLYFVLGSRDPHYSILDAETAVADMQRPWADLGAPVLPAIDVVDAAHGYEAEHVGLVTRWLTRVLASTPLLPPPSREYETPILDRKVLEIVPARYPGVTLHDLYAGLAAKTIAAHRRVAPLSALSREAAVRRVEDMLGVPRAPAGQAPRPVLLDDTAMSLHGRQLRFQYWLVGSGAYLRSGVLILFDARPAKPFTDVDLTLSTADPAPAEAQLEAALDRGHVVAVVIAPGFGPLAPSQSTTGNLARHREKGLTLPGMGVAVVARSVDLLLTLWPRIAVDLHTDGVDAGAIASFAVVLDRRIAAAWLTRGMASFESLLTAPTQPYVPPTLIIPGILAAVSVDDLRWLASPREIHVVSESDLAEFHPDAP